MEITDVTPRMLGILHHTLGLRPDRRESHRNHYVASPGHDEMPNLDLLVTFGFMRRAQTPGFCHQEDIVFVCTDAGKDYAIEHLPPEPKRTKYDEYLRADCCDSFAEFMGINRPMMQQRFSVRLNRYEYQMYRLGCERGWHSVEVSGDWAPTKKAAKESYKAALKAFNDRRRSAHA